VGFFDERYFFFFEETDWARAMREAGWKVYYVPAARIYHHQGQSIGANVRSRIEFYRSRYQYFQKWSSPAHCRTVRIVIVTRLLANWLLTGMAVILTLGLSRGLRDKWVVYTHLLIWHVRGA
jgi:GT2 family glycosyltransferase